MGLTMPTLRTAFRARRPLGVTDATEQDVTFKPFSVEHPAARNRTSAAVTRRNSRFMPECAFFAKIQKNPIFALHFLKGHAKRVL